MKKSALHHQARECVPDFGVVCIHCYNLIGQRPALLRLTKQRTSYESVWYHVARRWSAS